MSSTEKIPDSEVEVVYAKCTGCDNFILIAVKHMIDRKTKNEFGELAVDGHEIKTISLEAYHKSGITYCTGKH